MLGSEKNVFVVTWLMLYYNDEKEGVFRDIFRPSTIFPLEWKN